MNVYAAIILWSLMVGVLTGNGGVYGYQVMVYLCLLVSAVQIARRIIEWWRS